MTKLKLTLACGDYDRTRPLEEETVRPGGIELTYLRLPVEDAFFRMLRHHEFDTAEMSLSSYLMSLQADRPPFLGLPVFTSRVFRHGSIYLKTGAGITAPRTCVARPRASPSTSLSGRTDRAGKTLSAMVAEGDRRALHASDPSALRRARPACGEAVPRRDRGGVI